MQRWIGPALVGVGVILVIVGFVAGGGDDTSADDTTTTLAATSTVVETTTTVSETTTTAAATTSTASDSTTTTAPATTTTTQAEETVEEFVEDFSAALDAGDRDFVANRLHPVVYDGWGEDLCNAWIDREIMTLSDYTLIAVTSGPADATVDTPNGTMSVADMYEADVSFTFEGQSFDSGGTYAPIDGVMYWLGQCR